MKRWHWVALMIAPTAATMVWGCTMIPERIGQTSEALEAGFVSNNSAYASEIWGAWSPSSDPAGGETLVQGYNVNEVLAGWAFSTDLGASWTNRNTDSIDAGAGTRFRGDPVMVADHLGNVVYVNLFQSAVNSGIAEDGGPDNVDQVIALVSTDGGKTFTGSNFAIVNDEHCSDGTQDQPAAGFDYTTSPPTLWVGFRHKADATTGMCVRRGFLNPANGNHITWLGDAVNVQNFFGEGGSGVGGMLIQAGDGAVTVVYTNTSAFPGCPQPSSLNSFAIEALTSFDNGLSWQTKSRLFHSDLGPSCVLTHGSDAGADAGVNGVNDKVALLHTHKTFDFVRAPDGTYYVIAQDTAWQARLFKSRLQGAGSNGNTDAAWSEWCPNTATDDAGLSTSNWTAPGVECPEANWTFVRRDPPGNPCAIITSGPAQGSATCAIALPNIGADDQDRLVLSYYESDDTNQFFHVKVWANPTPRSPTGSWTPFVVPEPGDGGPNLADDGGDFDPSTKFSNDAGPQTGNARALGDYEGMAVRGGFGAPVCGNSGTFYPMYTVAFPTLNSQTQTVAITP